MAVYRLANFEEEQEMMEKRLEGLRVAILVTNDFERVELTEPQQALEEAGAQTLVIAPRPGQLQSLNHDVKADVFNVDLTLDEANPEDFDGVLIPGGVINADALRVVPKAQEFVRKIDAADKPIAVICHGPWLLVSAGVVEGRTLTSWPTLRDDIRNAGGNWVDSEVVRDGNWVSSRGPHDLPAFNREMVSLFGRTKGKMAA